MPISKAIPDERPVKLAMEELAFFTSEVRLLGTYKASPFRAEFKAAETDREIDDRLGNRDSDGCAAVGASRI